MVSLIENWVKELGIKVLTPSTEEELHQFEAELDMRLTQDIHSLYKTCNGLDFGKAWVKIPSLQEIKQFWMPHFRKAPEFQIWNYFPFIDDNTSDTFCVCCDEVMPGYIIQVYHDDAPKLAFRSLDSFFAELYSYVKQDEGNWQNLWSIPTDMDIPYRTSKDIEIGLNLLEKAKKRTEQIRTDTLRFGMWLLSEDHIDAIAILLDDSDMFVSRDAHERLEAMNSPRSQRILQEFHDSLQNFVVKCVDSLTKAGMKPNIVTDRYTICYQTNSHPIWFDLQVVYLMRREVEDVFGFLKDRVKYLLEQHTS